MLSVFYLRIICSNGGRAASHCSCKALGVQGLLAGRGPTHYGNQIERASKGASKSLLKNYWSMLVESNVVFVCGCFVRREAYPRVVSPLSWILRL